MKPSTATSAKPKAKGDRDSAGREEYADAPAMVAELIACDAYHPTRMIRRGHWQNLGHWLARAALVGAGSMALVGLTGPLGVVVVAGLVMPFAVVIAMCSHLDQFRGDRPLRLADQLDRWWMPAAQLWPVAFVYLLLAAAFVILANMNRVDVAAKLIAFGGIGFLGLAWTEAVAFRVLHHGELPDAVGAGIQQAGRRLARYPLDFLRSFTFRRIPAGERQLLITWIRAGVGSLLWGVVLWHAVVFGAEVGLDLPQPGPAVEFLAYLVAGAGGWHSFEAGVGVWVHHYLAYLAEQRGLVAEARKALAETQAT